MKHFFDWGLTAAKSFCRSHFLQRQLFRTFSHKGKAKPLQQKVIFSRHLKTPMYH